MIIRDGKVDPFNNPKLQSYKCNCLCHGPDGTIGPCGHCYMEDKK